MEEQCFQPVAGKEAQVTISIGVAQLVFGEEPAEQVAMADRNLYLAKQEDKNPVCFGEQS